MMATWALMMASQNRETQGVVIIMTKTTKTQTTAQKLKAAIKAAGIPLFPA
jgi:hypothetical protein